MAASLVSKRATLLAYEYISPQPTRKLLLYSLLRYPIFLTITAHPPFTSSHGIFSNSSHKMSLIPTPYPNSKEIAGKLKDLIMKQRKSLMKMYGGEEAELDKRLKEPIKTGEEMAEKLIGKGCPRVIAKDLTVLTLYDVAILIGMLWY